MIKFCLDIDAYLASQNVQRMDAAEERGYFRLLMAAKTIQETSDYGPGLPDDDEELAGLSLLGPQWFKPTTDESKRVGKLTSGEKLRKCFAARVASKPGSLFNRRMLKDWKRSQGHKAVRRRAGSMGAQARWGKPVMPATPAQVEVTSTPISDPPAGSERPEADSKSQNFAMRLPSVCYAFAIPAHAKVELTPSLVNGYGEKTTDILPSVEIPHAICHGFAITEGDESQVTQAPTTSYGEQSTSILPSIEISMASAIKSDVPFELTPFVVNGLAGNNGHSKMANRISSISDFDDVVVLNNTLNLENITNTENLRTDITSSEQRVRTRSRSASKPPLLADWQIPLFERFWAGYWRKVCKLDAQKAFGEAATSTEQAETIISAIEAQCPKMLLKDEDHRPHAATWLHGRRWNDELVSPEKIIAPQRPNRREAIRQGAMEIFRREKATGRAW